MLRGWNVIVAGTALLAVSGCYGFKYDQVKGMEAKGSAFDQALFKEYQAESRSEYLQGNYQMSDMYADKAMLAAKGQTPKPSAVGDWQLPSALAADATTNRQKLQALLDKNCQATAPAEMARAQVASDCWMEQTRIQENFQTDDIAACKKKFTDNLTRAEQLCAPKKAEPAVKPKDFLVFFDWNKSNLTPEALKIIADATAAAKQAGAKQVKIVGHTDTSGSAAYNLKLSERRAQAVAAQMIRLGVPATAITTVGRGQEDLLVPTPDNVREPQNRRTAISFSQAAASSDGREFVYLAVE